MATKVCHACKLTLTNDLLNATFRGLDDKTLLTVVGVFYQQYYLWGRSSDHKLGGSTRRRKQDAEFRQVQALGMR